MTTVGGTPHTGRHGLWARRDHWQTPLDDPATATAGARRFGEELKPQRRQEPGYRGRYSLVDRHTGRGPTMTLWDSEVDLPASAADATWPVAPSRGRS